MKYFSLGFIINTFTSFDDAITRIPLLSSTTNTRLGRLAFSIGNLLAVTVAIALSVFFAQFLSVLPYGNIFIAGFIFIMAVIIYFDLVHLKPPKKVISAVTEGHISTLRFSKLLILGFFMTLVTMTDDIFALAPLFLNGKYPTLLAIVGIYISSIILTLSVFYFAERIQAVPHKKSIATLTLIIFGLLILFKVL